MIKGFVPVLVTINEALFSYQNYYLDFVEDGAILHQTPNLGGTSRLYSFTDAEKWKPEGGDVINFYNRTEEIEIGRAHV